MDIMQMYRWMYQEDIPNDVAPAIDLLVDYAGISRDNVEAHLRAIREEAWTIARIPSIGRWRFIRLLDNHDPHYQHALDRLLRKDAPEEGTPSTPGAGSEDILLDLGCGMGQTMRQFTAAGVSPSNVFGLDNNSQFVELGFKLFGDEARLQRQHFIVEDMLSPNLVSALETQQKYQSRPLKHNVTLVHATSFWHLFGWDEQVIIARKIIEVFLRPWPKGGREPGAIIFGNQAGSLKPGETESARNPAYLHNQESLQRLWDEVGRATRTKWSVSMKVMDENMEQVPGVSKNVRPMTYGIYQVA